MIPEVLFGIRNGHCNLDIFRAIRKYSREGGNGRNGKGKPYSLSIHYRIHIKYFMLE
jgi:hypothetical protein